MMCWYLFFFFLSFFFFFPFFTGIFLNPIDYIKMKTNHVGLHSRGYPSPVETIKQAVDCNPDFNCRSPHLTLCVWCPG